MPCTSSCYFCPIVPLTVQKSFQRISIRIFYLIKQHKISFPVNLNFAFSIKHAVLILIYVIANAISLLGLAGPITPSKVRFCTDLLPYVNCCSLYANVAPTTTFLLFSPLNFNPPYQNHIFNQNYFNSHIPNFPNPKYKTSISNKIFST